MDWLLVSTLFIGILIIFLLNIAEVNANRREVNKNIKEALDKIDTLRKDLQEENKALHGHLLVLEERYLQLREKK